MIVAAKKGDEELEAKRLSRRGFLRMLAGGTAAAAVPGKTYVFFGNILRSPQPIPIPPWILASVGVIGMSLLLASPLTISGFLKTGANTK